MRHPRAAAAVLAVAAGMGLAVLSIAPGQQVHRNGFETRAAVWLKGSADAPFQEKAHDITEETAHTGQFAEHLLLDVAGQGNFIYYYYPTGRAAISDELSVSLWLKGNRPGTQLVARLVLPHERNPNNLDEPLTTLVRGDAYQMVGRWQRVELRRPVKLAQEQQQLMRAELARDVNFADAYIDRLMLNVYGGPGTTEIWIDDLEIGPLLEPERAPAPPIAVTPTLPGVPPRAGAPRTGTVELNQDHLMVNGKRFFFRGIRHSDTPPEALKALRDAGFNTIWLDFDAPPALVQEAVNLGFWVTPSIPASGHDARLTSSGSVEEGVRHFLASDAVLFWDLGGGLAAEHGPAIEQAARLIRAADPTRPLGADVWDGFMAYSRRVDLLGSHRWPLMTDMELTQYRDWLDLRRRLARPGTFTWTWVQTHLPDWYTKLIYDRPSTAGFTEPIGPLPEQIRLLTYGALAAGVRGIGYWSDRYLADTHQGHDRLLQLALLNQEMQLLEPLLNSVTESPQWVETSIPEIKAAVLRTDRGILVLPMWLGKGGQFCPGQSAAVRLSIVVPQVPQAAQGWEVSPGDVRALVAERVAGGTKVTLPEFGLTAAIVFTSDNSPTGLLVRLQDQCRRMRKLAAQWAHDLAQAEMAKVFQIEDELEKAGHTLPDGKELRKAAQDRLRDCVGFWSNGDYRNAYLEASRALRPVRIMMRAQWDLAAKDLDSPVASPYAVSFFTLPRHWQYVEEIKKTTAKPNVLTDGDFELSAEKAPASWTAQEVALDDVALSARRVTEAPQQGRQCLVLEVRPKNKQAAPQALERTYLAIHSPAVKLDPGSLARISGWVRIPAHVRGSPDGALVFDNAAGEPLGLRLSEACKWTKFTLYRRVPPSGSLHVTLALTGLGAVYFDDVRIEPLVPGGANPDGFVKPEPRDTKPTPATPASRTKTPTPATPTKRTK